MFETHLQAVNAVIDRRNLKLHFKDVMKNKSMTDRYIERCIESIFGDALMPISHKYSIFVYSDAYIVIHTGNRTLIRPLVIEGIMPSKRHLI